jgi:hypothetical protein
VGRDDRRERIAELLIRRLPICCLTTLACLAPAVAARAVAPVTLTVALDRDARLGADTALRIDLKIDVARLRSPVTQLRLLTPAGLEITSSGLGLATCAPSPSVFSDVLIDDRSVADCPKNAVLAHGTVTAAILLSPERTIAADGSVTLSMGAPRGDRPGLVAYVVPRHPVRAQLVYGGQLFAAPRPFGVGLSIDVPPVPRNPLHAPIALTGMRLGVGADDVVYRRRAHGKIVKYRPGGVPLPARCPRGGFRFRALLRFADDHRVTTDALAGCPRRGT